MTDIKHGGQYAYKVHKCRCPDCKAWNAAQGRHYRRNRIARGWKIRRGKWVMPQDSQLLS